MADEPHLWYGCGAARIGAICVSSARHIWPPAPGCLCVVEDRPVVSSDWLRPVMRGGGGWRAGLPAPVRGMADVS